MIISNQPVVALTSISTTKISSPQTTAAETPVQSEIVPAAIPTSSIIQTAQVSCLFFVFVVSLLNNVFCYLQAQHHQQQQHPSLVVSVPLANTTLSPNHPLVANSANPLTVMPFTVANTEKSTTVPVSVAEKTTPITPVLSGKL